MNSGMVTGLICQRGRRRRTKKKKTINIIGALILYNS
jgi:hypothetical protein